MFAGIVVALAIFIGARLGGIGLGLMGGLGVGVLTFGFHIQPTSPPVDVILIITAVITAIATMHTAGGLDFLVQQAEKFLRKHPKRIIFLGPLVTYLFTVLAGTGHIAYSLLPIIAEVSQEVGIRPDRALSVSTLASHLGITASPISAATVLVLTMLSPKGITLLNLLSITLPCTLLGLCVAAFVNHLRPHQLAGLGKQSTQPVTLEQQITNRAKARGQTAAAKWSVILLLLAILSIVLLGSFADYKPSWVVAGHSVTLATTSLIEMFMFAYAAIMVLSFRINVDTIVTQTTFMAGMKAVIAIFGIAWLGDSFFTHYMSVFQHAIAGIITQFPWLFGVSLFFMSSLLFSQAATVRALLPLGLALGIQPLTAIALLPAINGLFFIPSYPIEVSAINFDRTGHTKIGALVLNHSFMLPGLIGVTSSVVLGGILVRVLMGLH